MWKSHYHITDEDAEDDENDDDNDNDRGYQNRICAIVELIPWSGRVTGAG